MTTGIAFNGKPYAGNPHVRFDEGEVASAVTPRRGSLLYKRERALIFITALSFVAFPLYAGEIRWTGGGTVTFKADTSVNLTEKPASAFTFAETDGVFSGMPVAANMRRWKMVMSQDRKSIRIVPPGLMVIVK